MKEKLRINFTDMWGYEQYQFNAHDNYFTDLLSLKYDIEITSDKPDLLIYSVFGSDFKKYDCKKVFFTGENFSKEKIPDHYNSADLVMSHYDDSEKELLFPLWVIFINWFNKEQPRPLPSNPTFLVDFDQIQNNRERFLTPNRRFCAFINNSPVDDRVHLFNELSKYKTVGSHGKLFNNVGSALRGSEQDKIDLLRFYKMTIAFENSYHTGYNTEKIIQPFAAGCIPIYKGGERVLKYFNMNSFVYANNTAFNSEQEFYEKIYKIDQDEKLWKDIVMEKPLFMDAIMNDFAPEKILNRIVSIL